MACFTTTRRFAVPLIAVTSNPESTLAQAAEVVLALPHAKEACPHGLAPTTSTVMQLALGDCVAIALLESKGFTAIAGIWADVGIDVGSFLSDVLGLSASEIEQLVEAGVVA